MERPEDPRRALILILLASACFAAMWAGTRALRDLPGSIGPVETVFYRGLVGTILGLGIHAARGIPFRPQAKLVLLVRSATGALALLCTYGAIQSAGCEIATANLLLKTAPLWVVLLSRPVLGERPGSRAKAALVVGLAGVALALGPSHASERLGVGLGLLSGVLSASAYLAVRWLTSIDDPTTIVTCFAGFLALATAPIVGVRVAREGLPDGRVLGVLLLIGVAGTSAQLFMTNAFRHASAAAVSISGLAEVGFTALLSLALYHETPTWNAAVGGGLAVAAGVWATAERRPAPVES
jgi:drug/metabolite transporter (DMT)-like permease